MGLLVVTLVAVSATTFTGAAWLATRHELAELRAQLSPGTPAGPNWDNGPSAASSGPGPQDPTREVARARSRDISRAIDAILATPPAVPDDACESARLLLEDWLRRRKPVP